MWMCVCLSRYHSMPGTHVYWHSKSIDEICFFYVFGSCLQIRFELFCVFHSERIQRKFRYTKLWYDWYIYIWECVQVHMCEWNGWKVGRLLRKIFFSWILFRLLEDTVTGHSGHLPIFNGIIQEWEEIVIEKVILEFFDRNQFSHLIKAIMLCIGYTVHISMIMKCRYERSHELRIR